MLGLVLELHTSYVLFLRLSRTFVRVQGVTIARKGGLRVIEMLHDGMPSAPDVDETLPISIQHAS